DDEAFNGFVAESLEKGAGIRVGVEKARRLAAAIKADEEGVEGFGGTGENCLGAAVGEEAFKPPDEFAADSTPTVVGMDDQDADDADIGRELIALAVGAETGVSHSDDLLRLGVDGEDQAVLVEIALGKIEV